MSTLEKRNPKNIKSPLKAKLKRAAKFLDSQLIEPSRRYKRIKNETDNHNRMIGNDMMKGRERVLPSNVKIR